MIEGLETVPELSLYEAVKSAQALERLLGAVPTSTDHGAADHGATILRFKVTLEDLGTTSAQEGQRLGGAPERRAN